jgi:hypothetical protein
MVDALDSKSNIRKSVKVQVLSPVFNCFSVLSPLFTLQSTEIFNLGKSSENGKFIRPVFNLQFRNNSQSFSLKFAHY